MKAGGLLSESGDNLVDVAGGALGPGVHGVRDDAVHEVVLALARRNV